MTDRIVYVTGGQGVKGDKGDKGEKGDTGATGATGAQGPPGPAGGDVFTYTQETPLGEWVINHNRGRQVGVTLLDDLGYEVFADVFHGSLNQCTITFAEPTTGTAIIA